MQKTVIRSKQELKIKIPTSPIEGMPTKRMVYWAGSILQEPHKEVLHFSRRAPSKIWVGWVDAGSPSERHSLYDNTFIMEINSVKVDTLDDFLDNVLTVEDNTFVRLKVMDAFRSTVKVIAIKTDYHYHPCWQVKLNSPRKPVMEILRRE